MGIGHFRANRKRCSIVNIFTGRFKKMTHAKKYYFHSFGLEWSFRSGFIFYLGHQ